MHTLSSLKQAIESELAGSHLQQMAGARENLTKRYRERPVGGKLVQTKMERQAYIAARLPATAGVAYHVLDLIRGRMPDRYMGNFLDLGAGPGSVMWAAAEVFPEIEQMTLIDQDTELAAIGQRLASHSNHSSIRTAYWKQGDLSSINSLPTHDLVVFSYSIGELSSTASSKILEVAWNACKNVLVVIEPGTPVGFERIRTVRSELIALGGHLIAPCPHAHGCPMEKGNWCHFSQRIERSSLHRQIKEGSLGYEDEKFSYVAFSKTPITLPEGRILRHPLKRSGHVHFTLCAKEGLEDKIISKKTPDTYKYARKLEWGDEWT